MSDIKKRMAREATATGLIDGRTRRKGERTDQINLKTTRQKKQQLQRLAIAAGKTQIEVIEASLDLFERELNAE